MASALKNGAKQARGGKRKNAGRKRSVARVARDKAAKAGNDGADYCLAFLLRVVKGKVAGASVPDKIGAAREYMNRVWGKPPEEVQHTGEIAHLVRIKGFATEPPPGVSTKHTDRGIGLGEPMPVHA